MIDIRAIIVLEKIQSLTRAKKIRWEHKDGVFRAKIGATAYADLYMDLSTRAYSLYISTGQDLGLVISDSYMITRLAATVHTLLRGGRTSVYKNKGDQDPRSVEDVIRDVELKVESVR